MAENGEKFSGDERRQAFADYFDDKVNTIAGGTIIPEFPDIDIKRVTVEDEFFFTYERVLQIMMSLKNKKCHGYDSVPLLVLKDGAEVLAAPFTKLVKKIYQTKVIPDQWKISRTIPLFKKGKQCCCICR